MSAMPWETTDNDDTDRSRPGGKDEAVLAGTPVVVRRHAGLAALIGAAASAVAIAYLWRASQTMTVLDWTLFAVMAVIAAVYLVALVDARTPLLVADDLGVRVRLGDEWRGLPWEAIGQVVVHPRRGALRDGRLVLAPRSLARALDGLDGKGRRHVALNQKMYGAPLAVPMGLTTRVSTHGDLSLAQEIEALALGRAEVLELDPRTLEVRDPAAEARVAADDAAAAPVHVPPTVTADDTEAEPAPDQDAHAAPDNRSTPAVEERILSSGDEDVHEDPVDDAEPGDARSPRRSILGGIGTIVSRVAKGRAHDVDAQDDDAPLAPPAPLAPAARADATTPLRGTRPGLRAEATIELATTVGNAALQPSADGDAAKRSPLPEGKELRRPGSVDLVIEPVTVDGRVRPISTLGDPVEPLVIDDFVTEPAYDPVIGPELTAARTRLGLSVDELAERTRIRPHVIESIEVDDFAPCGGDFYARGHLRTLARILGKDAGPMLVTFEERYATAPINARRVFEAELATGMTGSMRSTVGGPHWGLLVGVVLSLVLVWGVVRLFTTEPMEMVEIPAPILNGSAGVEGGYPSTSDDGNAAGNTAATPAKPVAVRLSASQSDSRVVVRDGEGAVVFSGELVLGERKTLRVAPPVRIRAADGGAVEARVAGRDRGLLGVAGEPVRRTFGRP